jgi:hypothetical protein
VHPPWLAYSFWSDPWVIALTSSSVLLNLALFAFIVLLLPILPGFVPLHFSNAGDIDEVATKSSLLSLPITGAGLLAFDFLCALFLYARRELLGAGFLLIGAALLQLLLWVAIVRLAL